jgi:hypothetical protein
MAIDPRIENAIQSKAAEEKAQISALDAKLHNTPNLRSRLRLATSMVDDVGSTLLPFAAKAQPAYVTMWYDMARFNLSMAAGIRQNVQEIFDKYGPNIQEIG